MRSSDAQLIIDIVNNDARAVSATCAKIKSESNHFDVKFNWEEFRKVNNTPLPEKTEQLLKACSLAHKPFTPMMIAIVFEAKKAFKALQDAEIKLDEEAILDIYTAPRVAQIIRDLPLWQEIEKQALNSMAVQAFLPETLKDKTNFFEDFFKGKWNTVNIDQDIDTDYCRTTFIVRHVMLMLVNFEKNKKILTDKKALIFDYSEHLPNRDYVIVQTITALCYVIRHIQLTKEFWQWLAKVYIETNISTNKSGDKLIEIDELNTTIDATTKRREFETALEEYAEKTAAVLQQMIWKKQRADHDAIEAAERKAQIQLMPTVVSKEKHLVEQKASASDSSTKNPEPLPKKPSQKLPPILKKSRHPSQSLTFNPALGLWSNTLREKNWDSSSAPIPTRVKPEPLTSADKLKRAESIYAPPRPRSASRNAGIGHVRANSSHISLRPGK